MSELILAVLILMGGAGLALLPVSNRLRAGFGLASQALANIVALSVVIPVLFGAPDVEGAMPWAYPVGDLHFQLDALGAFFLSWSLPMTFLGAVYAIGYMGKYFLTSRHLGVHFALLNMISVSFLLVYTGEHTVTFLFGWEIAALAAWLLVIWDYQSERIRFAGFNYLVSTHIGLIFLVAAVMILYTHTHSWFLDDFGIWMRHNPGALRNTVFLLLVTSFGLKSAFFPFHSWLPRAHAAAPAHVSALMSGVIHKAGLYALVRFLWLSGRPDEWMGWFLIIFSITSALVGGLYTVGQRDLKRLLGYSSTENVGIAGIGFGIGCLGLTWDVPTLVALGFGGGLLHVLNHAFFKCQLFYAAGCVYQIKHVVDLERLGGLFKAMPVTAICFLVGGVAISALPPFNGFASEFLIYSGLFSNAAASVWSKLALGLVAAALAFVGAVSALSITRAYGVIFLGASRDESLPPAHEAGKWMLVPLVIHTLGTVVLGVFPVWGLMVVAGPTTMMAHVLSLPEAGVALVGTSEVLRRVALISGGLFLALLAILAWRLRPGSRPRPHVTWGCGYSAPSPRMQYTGASFSTDFAAHFRQVMVLIKRRKAPAGYFPTDSYVITDCVDAVERRLYSVINHGDETATEVSRKMQEDDPRFAFSAGLAAIVIIAALVLLAEGVLP
ncbi:MAG TPA: proton-conducting transporter membrane subunit [Aromatoleum sp.]|uniref:proton-conducting transporter transmembrane domain-containing protein n=1 Tax=Aromatoleum sp. TaxID=2307007 RepID=UPI002B461013|nr:proton-conducting transporter membrane subunit [Aromatoleum sp.]HJV25062.1 proton-conducting transporter membrane subunit [Aromatoleum sp.]